MVGVECGLLLQQNAGDREQPIGDATEGAAIGVAAGAQGQGERDEVVFPNDEAKKVATDAIETLDRAEVELKLWTMKLDDLFEDVKKATVPPVVWEGLSWMIED